jgi:hypothetical protein
MKTVNLCIDKVPRHAYDGLHRYGAEELGLVRTFLRLGRRYGEGQRRRFRARDGRTQDPTDA